MGLSVDAAGKTADDGQAAAGSVPGQTAGQAAAVRSRDAGADKSDRRNAAQRALHVQYKRRIVD